MRHIKIKGITEYIDSSQMTNVIEKFHDDEIFIYGPSPSQPMIKVAVRVGVLNLDLFNSVKEQFRMCIDIDVEESALGVVFKAFQINVGELTVAEYIELLDAIYVQYKLTT